MDKQSLLMFASTFGENTNPTSAILGTCFILGNMILDGLQQS